MALNKIGVELFYDVISPYSWIAFEALCRYQSIWNIDLQLKPVFLGGIMQAAGNKPPMMVANKAMYMMKDLERCGNFWGIKFTPMKDPVESILVKGSLSTMRFLVGVQNNYPHLLEQATREMFSRRHSTDQDIHLVDHFIQVAEKIGIPALKADDIAAKVELVEVKQQLKNNTNQALNTGAFGCPWINVHMRNGIVESFFGADRFHIIAHMIGERFPGPMITEKAKL